MNPKRKRTPYVQHVRDMRMIAKSTNPLPMHKYLNTPSAVNLDWIKPWLKPYARGLKLDMYTLVLNGYARRWSIPPGLFEQQVTQWLVHHLTAHVNVGQRGIDHALACPRAETRDQTLRLVANAKVDVTLEAKGERRTRLIDVDGACAMSLGAYLERNGLVFDVFSEDDSVSYATWLRGQTKKYRASAKQMAEDPGHKQRIDAMDKIIRTALSLQVHNKLT